MIFYSSGKPDEVTFIFFSSFKFYVMSTLLFSYYYGGLLCSIWFVSPGVFVYSSRLGYYVASYFELPPL